MKHRLSSKPYGTNQIPTSFPPHRRNSAERAIQTFKAHFIAGLCSADPDYPATEWDRLLPQAELTLNLLRSCRFNPKLSAHAALNGFFNFNATPLVPPGTKVLLENQINDVVGTSRHRCLVHQTAQPALRRMLHASSTLALQTHSIFSKTDTFQVDDGILRQSISDIQQS
jgi:hypothetical protein